MPNVEAASRGACVISSKESVTENRLVSVQTTLQTVDTIGAGLDHIKQEAEVQKQSRDTKPNDRFVQIMEVMVVRVSAVTANSIIFLKPFVTRNTSAVEALKKMGKAVEAELRSLLLYYGESPNSPEALKPEDFFSLIMSFSSSLQV
jgi:hypothetical protein